MPDQTTTPDPAPAMHWLLSCVQCGDGWENVLPEPFETAEARQQWADAHEAATGHREFRYRNLPAAATTPTDDAPRDGIGHGNGWSCPACRGAARSDQLPPPLRVAHEGHVRARAVLARRTEETRDA